MGKSSEKFIQEMDNKMYWDTHNEGYEYAQQEMYLIEQERLQEEKEQLESIKAMEIHTTIEHITRIIEDEHEKKDMFKELKEIFVNELKALQNEK